MTFFRLNRNAFLFAAVFFFFAANVAAKNSFSSPNLSEQDELLFTFTHSVQGSVEYSTIFKSKIKNGEAEYFPRAVTCFPESMQAFDGGKKILVKNRYGSAVYDFNTKALQWTERTESFPENLAAPMPVALSATGKWYCALERKDLYKGRLVITEIATGKKIVLSEDSAFSYSNIPVKWSPDGENLLYEKNDAVYLCGAEKLFKDVLLNEEFRKVCSGTINSAAWCNDERIAYISSDLLFQIEPKEIFSFGIYSQFVPLGKILGRLPQRFDCANDKFWVNSAASDFCIVRNSEMISWHKVNLNLEDDIYVKTIYSAPFDEREMTALSFDVFFTASGEVALCVKLVRSGIGTESSAVYTINSSGKFTRQILIDNTRSNVSISPDKSHIAFLAGEDVYVCKTATWKPVCQLKGESSVSLAWRDSKNLCVGGARSVKNLALSDFSVKPLFVSSAVSAWWTANNDIGVKDSADNIYVLSEKTGVWQKSSQPAAEPFVQNSRYRVFCGTTKNSLYENALYVRTLAGKIATRPFVKQSAVQTAPRSKVALVFDADENADGLDSILAICNEYNIKCTFFFNGEFIRRYPAETKKIAASQHECAAIFFSNVDLLDKAIYKDTKFVAKGLARLEDEFFACTGKELSLYWHAPYNKADKKVREEGNAAGYTYIDSSAQNIIQIGVGGDQSISDAALYDRFNLLVNELFANGTEIVTVSGLNQ